KRTSAITRRSARIANYPCGWPSPRPKPDRATLDRRSRSLLSFPSPKDRCMSESATSILFRHPSPKVRRAELRRFLKDLAREILPGQGVTCLIASDEDLSALNRKFCGKSYATDVLSFPPNDI